MLLSSQTAAAALCHNWLAEDKINYITGYDIALLTRDPLGPFQIDTFVRKVRLLLGPDTVFPEYLSAYVVTADSSTKKKTTTKEMVLRFGVSVYSDLPPITEKAISVIAHEYGKIWAELNLPNVSATTKEFLADLVVAVYMGDIAFAQNATPELRNFWRFHFERMSASSEYRRTLLPKVLKALQQTDNPLDTIRRFD